MTRLALLGVCAIACLAVPAGGVSAAPPTGTFTAHVSNPWFPLARGSRWVYTGVKDGKRSRDVVWVARTTRVVHGVPCAVVEDRLYLAGRLEERTADWYSQDAAGNVWYLGEDTAELDAAGRVTSREGTWQTGVAGARAGIFMPAHPKLGESGRQEYLKGQAEDHFKVIALLGRNAVLTEETTPLEPGTVDHKLYVRGIGTALEQTERGPQERNELVSFTVR